MKEVRKLVEYGVPIDPEVMVAPPEATELELEPGHPGLGDDGYVRRRKALFALCRRHRLERLGPPLIEYTPEETRIWRDVSPKLNELHVRHACRIYLDAKRDLSTLDRFNQYGEAGLAMIDAEVTRQAAMIAYLNDFELIKWMSLAAVPLVPLMRRSPRYGR